MPGSAGGVCVCVMGPGIEVPAGSPRARPPRRLLAGWFWPSAPHPRGPSPVNRLPGGGGVRASEGGGRGGGHGDVGRGLCCRAAAGHVGVCALCPPPRVLAASPPVPPLGSTRTTTPSLPLRCLQACTQHWAPTGCNSCRRRPAPGCHLCATCGCSFPMTPPRSTSRGRCACVPAQFAHGGFRVCCKRECVGAQGTGGGRRFRVLWHTYKRCHQLSVPVCMALQG